MINISLQSLGLDKLDTVIKIVQIPKLVKHRFQVIKDLKHMELLQGRLSKLKFDFNECLKEPNSDKAHLENTYRGMENQITRQLTALKIRHQASEMSQLLPDLTSAKTTTD